MNPIFSRPFGVAGAASPGSDLGTLGSGEFAIWRADLDAPSAPEVQRLGQLLSADELDRARQFHFERDRRRFVVGRGILRVLLGHYAAVEPREMAFAYGANGKPKLPDHPALFFNVAHSDRVALFAFTRSGEIGIDVERIRELPDWESIACSSFPPGELARVQACPPERRNAEFFRAWTRQEAILKALGTGLIGLGDARVEHVGVRHVEMEPGYVAAVAFLNLASDLNPERGSVVRATPGAFPIRS